MPFSIRPFRRFPVQCSVTYHAGSFQGQGTVGIFHVQVGVSQETPHAAKGNPLANRHAPE
jgi:hypothetical protein